MPDRAAYSVCAELPVPVIVTCHHTYLQQVGHIRSQFWKRIFVPFERKHINWQHGLYPFPKPLNESGRKISHRREQDRCYPNAVDTGRFHPLGTEKTPNLVLYVGRIDTRKGIEFLIRSMGLVRERLPSAHLHGRRKGRRLEKMKTLVGNCSWKECHVPRLCAGRSAE